MSVDEYTDLESETKAIEAQERELAARKVALARQREAEKPIILDEDGNEIEKAEPEPEPWPHETIEFLGDQWEVRTPTPDALSAFALATSKHVPPMVQNTQASLFFQRHLSPESFERFLVRWGDPDDEMDSSQVNEFMKKLVGDQTSRPTKRSLRSVK